MTKSVSSPSEKMTIDAFFSGVGGIELGFKETGKFRVVYANEFDKNALITYKENFKVEGAPFYDGDLIIDGNDIHQVKADDVPSADIVMGGFPCQAFSIAGYRKGFEDDRGDLFFELLRIVKAKKPRIVFIENVKNLVSHDHGNTFKVIREALVENGYFLKWKVLNGKDYGNVPQNRERIYVVAFKFKEDFDGFEFPQSEKLTTTLRDVIDFANKKEEKYYYREGKQPFYDKLKSNITSQKTVYQWRRQYVRENKNGVVPTLTANMGTGGHNVPLILTDSGEIRKLTPKETFNVQGYPKKYKVPYDKEANGQLYKQAGNSVVVPVIKRIAQAIADAIVDKPKTSQINSNKKYALIYISMNGRFEGVSFVKSFSENIETLKQIAEESHLKVLSDKDYLKLIKNNKSDQFYMIEEI
ncbi:DNA cytosine methyltransferase [Lactobacillus hominis]|uniref:DNA cytosine methyltransferase n=1 Tax=Lactobacillus hominis TaxID=1203033 RepID=UPI0023F47457|nr:DNA cytosine methyltransferase [Lactobacillus hominis]